MSLGMQDWIKALIMAVLAPCATYVGQVMTTFGQSGQFSVDWTELAHIAVIAAVAYLVKQYATNSQGVPFAGEQKPSHA
jgi:hypothetical protein